MLLLFLQSYHCCYCFRLCYCSCCSCRGFIDVFSFMLLLLLLFLLLFLSYVFCNRSFFCHDLLSLLMSSCCCNCCSCFCYCFRFCRSCPRRLCVSVVVVDCVCRVYSCCCYTSEISFSIQWWSESDSHQTRQRRTQSLCVSWWLKQNINKTAYYWANYFGSHFILTQNSSLVP